MNFTSQYYQISPWFWENSNRTEGKMELCPKCNRMTAERNHYTKELICYNRRCEEEVIALNKIKELIFLWMESKR